MFNDENGHNIDSDMFSWKSMDDEEMYEVPEDDDVEEAISDDFVEPSESEVVTNKDSIARCVMDEYEKDELEYAEQMADVYPDSAEIVANCVEMNIAAKDWENERILFEKLISIPRSKYGITAYTAVIKHLLREPIMNEEQIREIITEFDEKFPMNENCKVLLAALETKLGNIQNARVVLEETVKTIPTAPEAALELARIQRKLRMFDEANKTVLHALPSCSSSQAPNLKAFLQEQRFLALESILEENYEAGCKIDRKDVANLRYKIKNHIASYCIYRYYGQRKNLDEAIASLDGLLLEID